MIENILHPIFGHLFSRVVALLKWDESSRAHDRGNYELAWHGQCLTGAQ